LFATHPIHVENVAWMAGRADILCAVFVLLALLLYVRARREARAARALGLFALSSLCALLAMGSKEMGASVVLAIPLLELLLPLGPATVELPPERLSRAERRRRERELKSRPPTGAVTTGGWAVPAIGWLMLAAVTLAYLFQRREVLGVVTTPAARTPISMIEALFGSLGWYARKVVWAPPQSAFVVEMPGGLLATLGLLITLGWASAACWLVLARLRPPAAEGAEPSPLARWRAELVAVGLFLVTLAPSLAIAVFSISETRLAERYLYLPSVGACLLAGLLLARIVPRLTRGRALAALAVPAAAALLLAVPAGRASAERAKVWRSDLDFWIDAVKKAEDEGLPHLHLGMAFSRLDYTEKAIEQYEMAFEKYNDAEGRSKAQNNLASAFIRLERFEEAIAALQRALQENPRYPTAHYNWGVAEMQLAVQAVDEAERVLRINNALGQFRRALQLNPRYVKAHLRYGLLLLQIGQTEPGISHLQRVIMLDESSREAAAARSRLAALGR
jgi:tetratricopeptide (TPR) repeat protein